jgi:hypothetical protein
VQLSRPLFAAGLLCASLGILAMAPSAAAGAQAAPAQVPRALPRTGGLPAAGTLLIGAGAALVMLGAGIRRRASR